MFYFLWFIKGAHYYIEHWKKCLLRELIPTNGITEKIFSSASYLIICWARSILLILLIDSVVSISESMYFFYLKLQYIARRSLENPTPSVVPRFNFLWKRSIHLKFLVCASFHKIILYALNIRLRWNFHLKSMQVLFSWEFYWTISVKFMWGTIFFFWNFSWRFSQQIKHLWSLNIKKLKSYSHFLVYYLLLLLV